MAIYQRGKGFQVNFVHKGQRHIRQFDNESLAKAWEMEAKAALLKGQPLPEDGIKKVGGGDVGTLQNVYRQCCTYRWERLKGSKSAIINGRTFVRWCGALVSPKQAFSQENIDSFVRYLIDERRVTNNTLNRYMSIVRVMAHSCKATLDVLPEVPNFKVGQGRLRFFSVEEEALILQTLSLWCLERERDFFIFLIDTGARPWSEGAQFTWADVTEKLVTFWETKTGVSRSVPLTRRAYAAVLNQRRLAPHSQRPFEGLTLTQFAFLWKRIRDLIPALNDTVLYTARHTCCTRLIQRGIDIRRTQIWMGHSNIQTTMRYAHFAPAHLLEAVAVLEA